MMDRAERVHLRALCEAATPGPECTGISSRWCPRCGDCTCPGDPDRGDPMDDPRCPLHAASSPHGEDEEHSPDTAALLRLGDEARTALPALLDDSERLATAERERDEARAMLRNLLARVHRDGGQHSDAVGLAQATEEADEIIARDFAELARLRAPRPSAIVLRPVDPMTARGLPCACDEWGSGHLDGCPSGDESTDGRDA